MSEAPLSRLEKVARIIDPEAFEPVLTSPDAGGGIIRGFREVAAKLALSKASQVLVLVEGWSNSAQSQPCAEAGAHIPPSPQGEWVLVPREPTPEMIAAAEGSLDVWRKSLSRDEAMTRHYIPPPRKSHKFIASATPEEKHAIRYAAMLGAAPAMCAERPVLARDTDKSSPPKPTGDSE